MLESLIDPRKVERNFLKMFLVGILYASLSLLFVKWFFSGDAVLSQYSGVIVVTFSVMFSLPFMYFIIRQEEKEDEEVYGFLGVWNTHKDAIYALMGLFLGFIIAFSFWYIVLGDSNLFNAQIETYCMINSPGDVSGCVQRYDFSASGISASTGTGAVTRGMRFFAIIENNVYVMIFTLLLSLIFGAGAMFVLAWNASVIAAAIAIFTQHQLKEIPLGLLRYMIHGFPEITAYFIAALAGGMFGIGVLRNGVRGRKFLKILENTIVLLFLALIVIILAAVIEVYFTSLIF
ncbi:stage II sporulation protein M [Patescibacteria group bacterium]|nr:stage II sporulation protein M [Patescibacteria group bacterium]